MESPEKEAVADKKIHSSSPSHRNADVETADIGVINKSANPLAHSLKGRHMQMIAIGVLHSACHDL